MLHFKRTNICFFIFAIIILYTVFVIRSWNLFNDDFRDQLKELQKSLKFVKPSSAFHYNNTWKSIGNVTNRHKIYSAYFDARTDIIGNISPGDVEIPIGSLRIFAILPTQFVDTIRCVVRYDDFTLKEIKSGEAQTMHEDHSKAFAAFTVMCPIYISRITSTIRLPQAVAIAYPKNRLSHVSPTFVQISYPKNIDEMLNKSRPVLSVCVGPLQSNYSDALRIAEFVEMYRVLGAKHFYFYYLDSTDEVKRLLEYYHQLGLADIMEWNLQEFGTDDIHYNGIVAQYNECIYRASVVDNFRYAAIVDLDEIIIPLKHNSLADFLRQCDEGRTSGYIFRNVFFYKKDSNDSFSVPPHTRNKFLYSQIKVRRTVEIMPAYLRSKCIVNTRSVIEMGNHQLWRAIAGFSDSIVHQTVGLLFHYRAKCINCKSLMMVDYTARRFGSLIWDRVDATCLHNFMENNGVCPT